MSTVSHIELRDLAKAYSDRGRRYAVLHDVNVRIGRGEFVVVLGRSGSGKSTLLNLVGALDVPTSGEVFLDGEALTAMGESRRALVRRHHIGFVFQFFNLIPTLTVAENLLLPLELNGVTGAAARERSRVWLERVGLAGRGRSLPDELSGGEQQRVALARALVHDPALIIADEPTGNLDLDTARAVLAQLDDLCRDQGKTLVMATHSPEVVGMADRVLTIRDGHLEEVSRPAGGP